MTNVFWLYIQGDSGGICNAATNLNALVYKRIEVGGDIFENLLWDVPDVDEPGFCPLQIISNTMVSTCMYVMLVVMLFIT
jgi:hypothetical protein